MKKFLNQFKYNFQYKEGYYQFHTWIDGVLYYYDSTINKGSDMWSYIDVSGIENRDPEVQKQISEIVFNEYNRQ
jgi:hypothetical protein